MSVAKNNKQLRQMFEAKKLAAQSAATAKVEHKLATTTPAGDLVCRVCRTSMKNNTAFWEKHLASADHKMMVLKVAQAAKAAVAPPSVTAAPSVANGNHNNSGNINNNSNNTESEIWAQLQKEFEDLREMSLHEYRALKQEEVDEFIKTIPLAKKGKLRLMYKQEHVASSLPSTSSSLSSATSSGASLPSTSSLPSDFFDSVPSSSSSTPSCTPASSFPASSAPLPPKSAAPIVLSDFADPDDEEEESSEEETQTAAPMPSVPEPSSAGGKTELPVGFFDDKKVDKTMHEQKDFTKELQQFREIMVDAAKKNQQQQLADHKKLAVLRQHAEEEDQKALQARLEELKKQTAAKKELLATKKRKVRKEESEDEDDESDEDLLDTEGLFGWRAKNALDK